MLLNSGVKVVRLDETHALAVFSSIHAAEEILMADSKQFQTRSLKQVPALPLGYFIIQKTPIHAPTRTKDELRALQASATAKKVRWESLDTPVPPRQRPKSTAMVARSEVFSSVDFVSYVV